MKDYEKDCLDVLQQALDLAEEGRVKSVALVVCMDTGWATIIAGPNAADLNLGCDDLKDKILSEVLNGNVKKKSPILRGF